MADRPMRALTIHQPYAWAIVHGYKAVENRTWAPHRNLVGGWLLVHSGKRVANERESSAASWLVGEQGGAMPDVQKLARGALVGAVRLVGSEEFEVSEHIPTSAGFSEHHEEPEGDPWRSGPICWLLAEPVAFREPIPCKGAQGLWTVPEALRGLVRAQWQLAREGLADG